MIASLRLTVLPAKTPSQVSIRPSRWWAPVSITRAAIIRVFVTGGGKMNFRKYCRPD